jgi:hypothetical protein
LDQDVMNMLRDVKDAAQQSVRYRGDRHHHRNEQRYGHRDGRGRYGGHWREHRRGHWHGHHIERERAHRRAWRPAQRHQYGYHLHRGW